METCPRWRVTFKLSWPIPGFFMVDDAAIFKALTRSADMGGLSDARRERRLIDVLVKRALAKNNTAPKLTRHAPPRV